MKIIVSFVLGALTGAFLLWFGFGKTVLQLDHHLVAVDRFSGKASRLFVSSLESGQLGQDEAARFQALRENGNSSSEKSQWRALDESEIKQLGFHWYPKTGCQGQFYISFHNPFDKEVWVERIRVKTPPHNDRAAIDREYNAPDAHFPPLADSDHLISTNILYEDYYDKSAGSSTPPTVASITPSRIWIRN